MARLLAALMLGFVLPAAAAAQEAAAPAFPSEVASPAIPIEELALRLVPLTKDELAAATAAWLGIVRAKTAEMSEAQIAILRAEGAVADAARERLNDLAVERKRLFQRCLAVVDAWEKKGGDPAAIAEYRAWRAAIFVEETRAADARTLLRVALAWAEAEDGGSGSASTWRWSRPRSSASSPRRGWCGGSCGAGSGMCRTCRSSSRPSSSRRSTGWCWRSA